MEIIYSTKFTREYKKLPIKIKIKAEELEKIFRQNPHDSKLNTHKLHGRLKEFWSFSIGNQYGIIFEFGDNNTSYFHSVGNHDIYQ